MDDDDSLECRVCRGEAEDGRPLYAPCMCSGSIQYTHQDCLLQWLQHSNKDSCELCKYKFQFKPVYAEDAPQKVSTQQVLARCVQKGCLEWFPFFLRLALAGFLWLGVVPVTTSWIYRIWIHRSTMIVPELIRQRWSMPNLWNDCVSGIIIATFVIFSFLSLMSFADFLRFHWDVREGNEEGHEDEQHQHLDHDMLEPAPPAAEGEEEGEDEEEEEEEERVAAVAGVEMEEEDEEEEEVPEEEEDEVYEDEEEEEEEHHLLHDEDDDFAEPPMGQGEGDNDGDQVDVELHVAIDELMGIRGPFPFLLRNILWLTAFNGAYLGLFAFIPYSVGAAVVGAAEKYRETSPIFWALGFTVPASIRTLAVEVSKVSAEGDHTLQLPDLGIIMLGYLIMSAMVFTWRSIICAVCKRAALPMLGKVVRVLECTAAVVKVGLLLFLKMLFLPLLLGLWLDDATLRILGPGHEDRVTFASENLVGALLLHWVAGITFMLFVTVSVLQLREVLHPDILGKIIRPQEPQPDLLGSLLQESGMTHARRMAMSLIIYIVLLVVFVWLPAHVLMGPAQFQLRTFYLAPQLQIPVELVLFHLAMLTFLERFKWSLGRIQYVWLRPFCEVLGLTRYLLPVQRFRLAEGAEPAAGQQVEVDQHKVRWVIGPPLRRPPLVLDQHGEAGQGRWAWGNEIVSDLERSLAPRQRPYFVGVRMLLLFAISWAASLLIIITALLVPLLLGRAIFTLLYIPPRFHHDPFAFATGIGICYLIQGHIYRHRQSLRLSHLQDWLARRRAPPLKPLAHLLLFSSLWLLLCPLLLGLLYELTLTVPSTQWAEMGLGCLHPGRDWALGLLLLHAWAYACFRGFLDGIWPQRPGRGVVNQWQAALQETLQTLSSALVRWNWEAISFPTLLRPFAWPLAMHLLEIFVLPINAALILSYFFRSRTAAASAEAGEGLSGSVVADMQISCFRMTVLAWLLAILSLKCAKPLSLWFQSVHDAVRDEHYLLGVQLQNHLLTTPIVTSTTTPTTTPLAPTTAG